MAPRPCITRALGYKLISLESDLNPPRDVLILMSCKLIRGELQADTGNLQKLRDRLQALPGKLHVVRQWSLYAIHHDQDAFERRLTAICTIQSAISPSPTGSSKFIGRLRNNREPTTL